eukprot:TRINITY_DN3083_c0_g1_i2.p1 TRINITY_DN3083_c0_g1~~TRINITY_DN3083_c0_g1_i2.p1  ORF type:complete len:297 (+),score=113.25 TRINITY_DN3083_c0_g1_i2:296-1186(+)
MNSSKRGGRYWAQKFPAWNYGCTLSNNSQTGAYETHVAQTQEQTEEKVEVSPPTPPAPSEDLEKPIQEILQGRNAIVFVNEQSKIRGLSMEWEQVAESGPPHLKVFSWSLKVGEHTSLASANSKKAAKNKAAEDMARKLDALPKPKKRSHEQMMMNGYPGYNMPPMMMPPTPDYGPWKPLTKTMLSPRPPKKKKKKPAEENKAPNPSQDNPISQLYEYCKRVKSPEPIFTTIRENPLEPQVTDRRFIRKKVEFTLQVDVLGKTFEGTALTKKEAKYKAAGMAWDSIQEEKKVSKET